MKFKALKKVPGKKDCLKCIDLEPELQDRSWKDVKNLVYNAMQTEKREVVALSASQEGK